MKDSTRRKPYSIVGMDPGSEVLAIYTASKVRAELGDVTH